MNMRSVHRSSALSLPLMVLAVAAGAVAGLLLAPANGSATRARLRGRAADAGSRLRRYAESMYDRMPSPRQMLRAQSDLEEPPGAPLTATIGEINAATQSSH